MPRETPRDAKWKPTPKIPDIHQTRYLKIKMRSFVFGFYLA